MIEIKNLCKSFGEQVVLNGLNVNFQKGKTVSIIGPSGSGKSTFLRCINYMEEPTAGEVLVDKKAINSSNLNEMRQKIGMVFQDFNLFPHMTVLENIMFAPIKILNQNKDVALKNAKKLLRLVHLEKVGEFYPGNLSGGQKQRVAIARAMAMEPEVLLFDEPTSSLDPEMVKEVLEVIRSLTHTGITMIIVTHEMNFAKESSDRVLFFDGGGIVEDAVPKKFFHKPSTKRAQVFLDKVL